jgi:hypothetical protein
MADNNTDALVVSDAEGHYYVIPRDVIEQTRVDDEAREQIDEALGIETQGFQTPHLGMGFSMLGPLNVSHQGGLGGPPNQGGWPYYKPGIGMDKGDPAGQSAH